jgi:RND family efflux transporter MFP subunit
MPSTEQKSPETAGPAGPSRNSRRTQIAAIGLLVLVIAGGFSVRRRLFERKALAQETELLAVPTVAVIQPSAQPSQDELTLPAQLQAYVESSIYSRTNGYLLHWYKDIGSRVKKGELLAEIDTPEVDQELSQARATRQQIAAQNELAKTSAERWTSLRKAGAISQQDADQQTNQYAQTQANLAAAEANVRRLEQLESFKHIDAPFSGVITRRNVDVGALITAGSAGQTKELFVLAQFDPLRVYVNVPQANAALVRRGMRAYVELRETPGQKFSGVVVRTADAIDPATRTMLTEVDVPNHDGHLMPGAYAQLHFAVPIQATRISVPVNALLFRPEGPSVAVVGTDQKVHLKTVVLGRDFGNTVEVLSGLAGSEKIVVNPADSLEDGQQVRIKSGA